MGVCFCSKPSFTSTPAGYAKVGENKGGGTGEDGTAMGAEGTDDSDSNEVEGGGAVIVRRGMDEWTGDVGAELLPMVGLSPLS